MADAPQMAAIIAELEEAIAGLQPPFLALPEHGEGAEQLAYRRGVRDAYAMMLRVLKENAAKT